MDVIEEESNDDSDLSDFGFIRPHGPDQQRNIFTRFEDFMNPPEILEETVLDLDVSLDNPSNE